MKSPVHLVGKWWLVKDSTRPSDYPPEARDELTRNRLDVEDYRTENQRLRQSVRA